MKYSRMYLFLALIMAVSLAAAAGCSKVTPEDIAPAAPIAPGVITAPVAAPVAGGAPDLVITKVWLEGQMVYYTIKNAGAGESPQTYTQLSVNDLIPTMGDSSFVDALKPGQEKTLTFSSYQWPYGANSGDSLTAGANVNPAGYIDPSQQNYKVKVCADAKSEAGETVESNNCMVKLWGLLVDYDMLATAHLATWRNSAAEMPDFGNETSTQGAHFKVGDGELEVVPQQVPQGWIQGTWGYFYTDKDFGNPRMAAIKIPANMHFVARVGLAKSATGSDGVTFKFGLKDLNDNLTFIGSKKMAVPDVYEDWDIILSQYEGQRAFFVLRAEAGASPVNDFAIWKTARIIQVSD